MLDVTRLRVLVAVARHGSVTAAARSLNYAQPSVSHHLARLEAETGTQLTQRSGRGVRLTEAGRLLAERAEEILGRLEAAETELAAQVGQRAQRVRLAAFPSALATLIPAAAARLRALHPGTDLLLTEAESAEAVRMLRAGRVDVALASRYLQDGTVVQQAAGDAESARSRLILAEPVLLLTAAAGPGPACQDPPAGHDPRTSHDPRTGHDPRTSQDPAAGQDTLAGHAREPWIASCEDSRGYLLWACDQAGFTPKVAVTTDDHVAAQALVAAGLGVTILPELALRAARHPGIRSVPLPGASRQVLALTYGEPPDPPAVCQLLDVLSLAAGHPPAAADLPAGQSRPASRA
jgi:DNA-binding transcriptional LysR family regulator